jgi:hypothetical protein
MKLSEKVWEGVESCVAAEFRGRVKIVLAKLLCLLSLRPESGGGVMTDTEKTSERIN